MSDQEQQASLNPHDEALAKLADSDLVRGLIGPEEDPGNQDQDDDVVAEAEGEEEELEATEETEELEASDEDQEALEGDEEESDSGAETIEYEGKTYNVAELVKGHMLHSDYTQKTQKLAEERKAASQERLDVMNQVSTLKQQEEVMAAIRNAHAQRLSQAITPYENLDWNQLAKQSPEQYQQRKAEFAGLQAQRQQFIAEDQQIQQLIEEMRQERAKAQAKDAVRRLPLMLGEEWTNELYGSMREFATSQDWTRDEFDAISDPKIIRALRAEMKLAEGERKTREALELAKSDQSGKVKRIGSKRTRRGVGDPQARQARQENEARSAAINSGDPRQIAAYMAQSKRFDGILSGLE